MVDNQEVTRLEFENDWLNLYQLGNAREANLLFNKADANGDGHLTHADMPLIYQFFDVNSEFYLFNYDFKHHQINQSLTKHTYQIRIYFSVTSIEQKMDDLQQE